MESSVSVGTASQQKHYEKLIRDYEMGFLPPDFDVEDIREKLKQIKFTPKPILQLPWNVFWELRSSKAYESPINHTDIFHYTKLMLVELEPWEVKTILRFDRVYYKSYEKHHSKVNGPA